MNRDKPAIFTKPGLTFSKLSPEQAFFWTRIRTVTEKNRGLLLKSIDLTGYTGFDIEFLQALAKPYSGIIHWDVDIEVLPDASAVQLFYGEMPNTSALAMLLKEYITRFDLPDIVFYATVCGEPREAVVVQKDKFKIFSLQEVLGLVWYTAKTS